MALGFDPDVVREIGGGPVLEPSARVRLDRLTSDRERCAGTGSPAVADLSFDLELLARGVLELRVLEVFAIDAGGDEGRAVTVEASVHLDRLAVCKRRSGWHYRCNREIDGHTVQHKRAGGKTRNSSPQLVGVDAGCDKFDAARVDLPGRVPQPVHLDDAGSIVERGDGGARCDSRRAEVREH